MITDVYYYNYSESKYEFICHHQRPVSRRSVYERMCIQNALKDYYHGYTDDNGTAISYNEYKELEYMSMCDYEEYQSFINRDMYHGIL